MTKGIENAERMMRHLARERIPWKPGDCVINRGEFVTDTDNQIGEINRKAMILGVELQIAQPMDSAQRKYNRFRIKPD